MRTFDGLLAVFGEGQEHVEAFVAVVTDKVIGWHEVILIEITAIRKYSFCCFFSLSFLCADLSYETAVLSDQFVQGWNLFSIRPDLRLGSLPEQSDALPAPLRFGG